MSECGVSVTPVMVTVPPTSAGTETSYHAPLGQGGDCNGWAGTHLLTVQVAGGQRRKIECNSLLSLTFLLPLEFKSPMRVSRVSHGGQKIQLLVGDGLFHPSSRAFMSAKASTADKAERPQYQSCLYTDM